MDRCPTCTEPLHNAQVVCAGCGEVLPLQIVVVSEGSQGGGFALVKEVREKQNVDVQDERIARTTSEEKEASL